MNFGCPQSCARRGGYGAFLDDAQAAELVKAVAGASALPATAKIRCRATDGGEGLRADVARTVAFARRLEAAGASLIAVHGRHCPPPASVRAGIRQKNED